MRYLLAQSLDNHLGKVPLKCLALEAEPQKKYHSIYSCVKITHKKKKEKKKEKVDVFVLALFTKRAPCSPWMKAEIPSKIKECCMENQ